MWTRQRLRGGIEYDTLTRFRRRIRLRRGEIARAKRQFWKRIRKQARAATRNDAADRFD